MGHAGMVLSNYEQGESDQDCLMIEPVLLLDVFGIPGYSELTIHGLSLPDQGCPAFAAMFNPMIMAFSAGVKRSRKQWSSLLGETGFEMVGFWVETEEQVGVGKNGVVETVIKQ